MAATKRNAGLTSVLPRATLNDEELVKNNAKNSCGWPATFDGQPLNTLSNCFVCPPPCHAENARLQENAAGLDLPDFQHDSAQFPAVDGLLADLLLRVRGSTLGHRSPGRPLHRMRSQMPRKVQGFAQRRLSPK